jgi:hypothetical protein
MEGRSGSMESDKKVIASTAVLALATALTMPPEKLGRVFKGESDLGVAQGVVDLTKGNLPFNVCPDGGCNPGPNIG